MLARKCIKQIVEVGRGRKKQKGGDLGHGDASLLRGPAKGPPTVCSNALQTET